MGTRARWILIKDFLSCIYREGHHYWLSIKLGFPTVRTASRWPRRRGGGSHLQALIVTKTIGLNHLQGPLAFVRS